MTSIPRKESRRVRAQPERSKVYKDANVEFRSYVEDNNIYKLSVELIQKCFEAKTTNPRRFIYEYLRREFVLKADAIQTSDDSGNATLLSDSRDETISLDSSSVPIQGNDTRTTPEKKECQRSIPTLEKTSSIGEEFSIEAAICDIALDPEDMAVSSSSDE